MTAAKRLIVILALIVIFMLILPLIGVNIIKGQDGMAAALLMLFIINPVISIIVGVLSAKDVRRFFFTPVIVAILSWIFSSFTYQSAFPVVYSSTYFVICLVSMFLTWAIHKKF